jgi:hypothetical protein
MPASYMGGKVPKLIVRDVFQNILRYYCAKKISLPEILDPASSCVGGQHLRHWTLEISTSY